METYIERICAKYIATWMNNRRDKSTTPLPNKKEVIHGFLAAVGDNNPLAQQAIAKEMSIGYRSGVGEILVAMVTVHPDLCYADARLLQHNVRQHRLHYVGLKYTMRFMFHTKTDEIYYWRTEPNMALPPKLRCSMGGGTIMLAGGTVGYKANLMPTVAMSSMEAEFMEVAIVGRMVLYCRSVMWDLGV